MWLDPHQTLRGRQENRLCPRDAQVAEQCGQGNAPQSFLRHGSDKNIYRALGGERLGTPAVLCSSHSWAKGITVLTYITHTGWEALSELNLVPSPVPSLHSADISDKVLILYLQNPEYQLHLTSLSKD